MRAHELTVGRTFGVTFDHGEDFFEALSTFCQDNGVRQGYIPSFVGAFVEAEIVGACEKLADPDAPDWAKTYVANVEAFGAGTIAHDPATGGILPHIHVSAGLKAQSADGRTSHLLSAKGPVPQRAADRGGHVAHDDPAPEPRPLRRTAAHVRLTGRSRRSQ